MIKYRKNGADYIFELRDGILTVNGKKIPCRKNSGYSISIGKKSVASDTGAEGVYNFLKKAIEENFCMIYVWKVLNLFA